MTTAIILPAVVAGVMSPYPIVVTVYDGIPECVKERRYLAVVPPFRHQYGEHEQDEEREKRRNAFIEG